MAHIFSRYHHYNLTIFLSNQTVKTLPTVCRSTVGSGMYKITIQRFGSRPSTFLRNVALLLPFTGEVPAIAPTRGNQCTASIATTGQRCTATARRNGFCGRHQGHADKSIASARLNNANRCTAIVAAMVEGALLQPSSMTNAVDTAMNQAPLQPLWFATTARQLKQQLEETFVWGGVLSGCRVCTI